MQIGSIDRTRRNGRTFSLRVSTDILMPMKPLVRILMGSDSDLLVMKDAAAILGEFGVAYQMTVLSAHRTPEKVVHYVRDGEKDGARVFIAAAGGAAHLAGAVAAQTTLPVIGVPILGKSTDGIDSLLSTVQMRSEER